MSDETVFRTFISESLENRLQDGIQYALKLGAIGAEVFVKISHYNKADVQDGILQNLSTSKRGGISVRVLSKSNLGIHTGITTSTNLTNVSFNELFEQAWQLSLLNDADHWTCQLESDAYTKEKYNLPSNYDDLCMRLTTEDRIKKAIELETETKIASEKVSAIRESTWTDAVSASMLLTQKNIRTYNLSSSCSASIELALSEKGDNQSAWHWQIGRSPNSIDLRKIAQEAVRKGEWKLNPSQIKSGRYNIVLHPEVTVDLLNIIASMLSAESVLKQKSLFIGKIDSQISSNLLSLVDDGRLINGLGSKQWDDEGLSTQKNIIIKEGHLCTYMHTLKTAAEMKVKPTASARRSMGSNPYATVFNLFPIAGKHNTQDLYKMTNNGVLITEIMGLHTINPISGDFSVGASGIRINNGELSESVNKMTFAGNLKQFLHQIIAVGNDLSWYGNSAGVSILLNDINLGGI